VLRGSSGSCGGCGSNCGWGVDAIVREYIDMFVCAVVYIVVVGMVGSVIGYLASL